MKRSIAVFLIALAASSVAWAGSKTDREALQKIISKIAPDSLNKSKTGCVCLASGSEGRVGRLYQNLSSNQVKVACYVPIYDAAGNDSGGFQCAEYLVLR